MEASNLVPGPARSRIRGAAVAAAVLAVLLALPSLALAERHELAGERVGIWNLAGEVEVVEGTGPNVVVTIERGGDDADRLEVVTGQIDGQQTLRILYPSSRVRYGRGPMWGWGSHTTLRVARDGRFSVESARSGRRVRIGGSGLDARADLRIEVPKGRAVAVYLAVGDLRAHGVTADLHLDTAASSVHASDITGALMIDVGSGSVTVRQVVGDLNVDTGSGSVSIQDVTGQHLRADTGSGRVAASGVRAERVSVDTGSGGVELTDVMAADVSVDTGSGSVSVDLRSTIRSLAVDTGSGSVTVRMPENVSAMVDIDTGSGGITSDIPMQVTHKRRDSLRGRMGAGEGRIVIETGSGSVRLRKS